ncbi:MULTISPECIES: hypothetical protein [Streptomyces]|uniref:hypothetical protein n=1 Tax=Streptomyces TaxID=1883 RepID=UPI00345BCE31
MGWAQAYGRAETFAEADQPVTGSWEFCGVRGILAIALSALGDSVEDEALLRHLEQGPGHVRELAAGVVGDELAWATDIDPASVDMSNVQVTTWVWLTRTWPEGGPWEGRTRGIGRGLTSPAVDILTGWAARAVEAGLPGPARGAAQSRG